MWRLSQYGPNLLHRWCGGVEAWRCLAKAARRTLFESAQRLQRGHAMKWDFVPKRLHKMVTKKDMIQYMMRFEIGPKQGDRANEGPFHFRTTASRCPRCHLAPPGGVKGTGRWSACNSDSHRHKKDTNTKPRRKRGSLAASACMQSREHLVGV